MKRNMQTPDSVGLFSEDGEQKILTHYLRGERGTTVKFHLRL
jgi:hypothetical protein